ncbi:MAG: MFS transporter [Armatimonadota bacterium]
MTDICGYEREQSEDCVSATVVTDGVSNTSDTQSLTAVDIRHNMIVLIMMDAMWIMGSAEIALASGPLYVFLNASNTIIGLIGSVAVLGLVGVFLSPFISVRCRVKKWYLLIAHIPYLAPWGAIGAALIFSRQLGLTNEWLLSFVLIMNAVSWFFGGFVTLPHTEYTAACIPMSHRGRFGGYGQTFGAAAGLISNSIGALILLRVAKPSSFGYLYIMTWAICQGGYMFALLGRERPTPIEKVPKPWSKTMVMNALRDKPYVRVVGLFLLYNTVFIPLLTFVPVYGFRELKMAAATSATIGIIQKTASLLLSAFLGRMIDKLSPKRVLMYWPLLGLATLTPIFVLHNQYGVYATAAIGAVFFAGEIAALNALLYGMPSPENRAGHFTFQILAWYASLFLGPLVMGFLCDKLGYRPTFGVIALIAVLSLPISRMALAGLSDKPQDYS